MPHIQELATQAQRDALWRANIDRITTKVYFRGRARVQNNPGSFPPVFDPLPVLVDVDLTNILDVGGIAVGASKNRLPDGTLPSASDVQIKLVNTDEHFATTQTGGIIHADSIEQGEFIIMAQLSTAPDLVPIYRGRIIGLPKEEQGRTTFTCRETFWDAIRKPIVYENFGNVGGKVQSFAIDFDGDAVVQPISIPGQFGHFCVHHGLVRWTGDGHARTAVNNSQPDKVKIRFINIANAAPLGKYTITFTGPQSFELVYPDNTVFSGTTNANLVTPFVVIPQSAWIGPVATVLGQSVSIMDATGAVIDFNIHFTVTGNPVAIIWNLLEKALLNNPGGLPTLNPGVRINRTSFAAAAAMFAGFVVHVDVTNEDNKVFERRRNARPINYYQIAQRVADHVGAFLTASPSGEITLIPPFMDDNPIYEITTLEGISTLTIMPESTRWNYFRLQYGHDSGQNSYAGEAIADLRDVVADDEIVEETISAPYYKVGKSDIEANWLRDLIIRKYFPRQIDISVDVAPNFALVGTPGDRMKLVSREQPRIECFVELNQVNRVLGNGGKWQLVPVADPEGPPVIICETALGSTALY